MIQQNLYFSKLMLNEMAVTSHDVPPGNFLTMSSKFTALTSDSSGKKNFLPFSFLQKIQMENSVLSSSCNSVCPI